MIIDGKKTAEKIYKNLQSEINAGEIKAKLGAILVGDDSVSLRYISQKKKFAEKIGMGFELIQLPEDITQQDLLKQVMNCNQREDISGYIVQLPLPKHIEETDVINAISPKKDVDGFHPQNAGKVMIGDESGFAPCTPAGVIQLLGEYNIPLTGKNVTIIGRSNIVGKPLALMCINAGATVSSCNSQTKNIEYYTKNADIIITATGVAHMLKVGMCGESTTIIDVGFSVIDRKIFGDAQTAEFIENGYSITPVPGGVGPMTVAMLMNNTLKAHKLQHEK